MRHVSAKWQRNWKRANPDKVAHDNKKRRLMLRGLVLSTYDQKCVRCGAVTQLELDHIYPLVRARNNVESEWIDALVFPKKYFQILCRTCNKRKQLFEDYADYPAEKEGRA